VRTDIRFSRRNVQKPTTVNVIAITTFWKLRILLFGRVVRRAYTLPYTTTCVIPRQSAPQKTLYLCGPEKFSPRAIRTPITARAAVYNIVIYIYIYITTMTIIIHIYICSVKPLYSGPSIRRNPLYSGKCQSSRCEHYMKLTSLRRDIFKTQTDGFRDPISKTTLC